MTKLSSGLFILLIATLVLITIADPSVSTGQMTSTRSMPASRAPGESFTVTINIDVDENNPPSALTVNERVPSGLTVGEANPPSFSPASGSLVWVITPSQSGDKIKDQAITYSVTGSAPGAYAFNGNVYAGSNSASTEGSITIMIKEPCTENWTCGEWSSCQHGAEERTCTDSNSCPLPESRPTMSQACTAANPSPEDQGNPSGDQSGNDASGNNAAGNGTTNTTSDENIINQSSGNQSGIPDNIEGSETGDDSKENITSQAIENKENKTADEKITGKALDSAAGRNASGSSFSQVSAGNVTSEESRPQDNSNIPLITIALAVILVAVIAILGMKQLNLIGTSCA